MQIACAIIGNEILSGHIQDQNIRVLAQWLRTHGHELALVEILPDEPDQLKSGLQRLMEQFPLVVTSGGLGPTLDDITKAVLAQLSKTKLEENADARSMVSEHYRRIGREWNPQSNNYHLLPKAVLPLSNPCGLAPGLLYSLPYCDLLAFPGVPGEFSAMIQSHLPRVLEKRMEKRKEKNDTIKSLSLRTRGIPEEKIFFELSPGLWPALLTFGSVSSLPRAGGVDIVVSIKGNNTAAIEQQILALPEMTSLKPYLWQIGDKELPEYVLERARIGNKKLAIAESCTGGLILSRLTDIPGSSDVLCGGVVCYSNEMKMSLLGVDKKIIETHGAVSVEVASQMVQGILKITNADIAVATSGIAGPGGGSKEKPVGTLALAWAQKNGPVQATSMQLPGNRLLLKQRFCDAALFQMLKMLEHPLS